MRDSKILFVLTGHDRLGALADPSAPKTGFHLAEAARPWAILVDAGFHVDFVTPAGGKAPIDPGSREVEDDVNERFMEDEHVQAQLGNTRALAAIDVSDYDAIYFPGGHGTMWDLPDDESVHAAVRSFYEAERVVAAICHGPAALVNVRLSNGGWLVKGKTVTCFTDEEETAIDKHEIVPFLLETRLEAHGAKINKADKYEACVSVDGHLVTGQNPASATELGERIRDLVSKRIADAA